MEGNIMELGLEGKKALVVASSQGLGRAIAEQLVREGAHVMITSRSKEKLAKVVTSLGEIGKGTVASFPCDITKAAEVKALAAHTAKSLGGIDILINNAGGPPAGSFEMLDDDDWIQAFELNLLSYIRMIRAVLPYLKESGGRIINIASSSIKEPIPNLLLSNTFRTGIVGLSKTLSQEFAPYNILVNTVAPGVIATDRIAYLDHVAAERAGISREEIETKRKQTIPLQRYGEPEEFAKVVAFLVSEANTYMTGSSFLVDGGMIKSI